MPVKSGKILNNFSTQWKSQYHNQLAGFPCIKSSYRAHHNIREEKDLRCVTRLVISQMRVCLRLGVRHLLHVHLRIWLAAPVNLSQLQPHRPAVPSGFLMQSHRWRRFKAALHRCWKASTMPLRIRLYSRWIYPENCHGMTSRGLWQLLPSVLLDISRLIHPRHGYQQSQKRRIQEDMEDTMPPPGVGQPVPAFFWLVQRCTLLSQVIILFVMGVFWSRLNDMCS